MKVLIVEDDKEVAETLGAMLSEHYIIELAASGKEAEYKVQVNEYSCILLDFTLPDMDGIEFLKGLRQESITTPVIMLTGNSEVDNKVKALNGGADDYILKPVNDEELHARIEAVVRRSDPHFHSNTIAVDNLIFDISKKQVSRGDKKLKLKRKELDILEYLMRNEGRVLTRSMIFDRIWDSDFDSDTNLVDVHIKYIRDQVDRDFKKKLIKTVHGYGYKIEA